MTLASFLHSICDLLGNRLGVPVVIGAPNNDSAGVFLFPWKISPNTLIRNSPPVRPGPATTPGSTTYFDVHILVLTRPALTGDGLSQLESASRAILESPIITVGTEQAELLFESLSNADLAAIFSAAGMPLSVCLSVMGRGIGYAPPPPIGPAMNLRDNREV